MTGFKALNYTPTPNDLFDVLLRDLGDAELRVVLVAVRQTMGWHKTRDAISLTQFERMSGLSRRAVIDGVGKAVNRGLLRQVGTAKRGVNVYELVIGEAEEPVTESNQLPKVTSTSEVGSLELVNVVHTQKKLSKETTKEKNSASVDALNTSESAGVTERDVNEMIAGWWEWTNKPTRRGSVVPAKAHFANKENRAYARALLERGVTAADMIRTLADIRLNPKSRWQHLAERELTFCYVAPICEEWTQHERLHGFVYSEQFPRVTARRPDVVVRTGVYDDPDTIVDVPPVYVRAQAVASADEDDADVSGMTADQLLAWIGEEL